MIQTFLERQPSNTGAIDALVRELHEQASCINQVSLINHIGSHLLRSFWHEFPAYAIKENLKDDPDKNGIYYNGKNVSEVTAMIRAGKLPFWKAYGDMKGEHDPISLMQLWLREHGKTSFNFTRTPDEILSQQYLGNGGGCGEYVSVMTELLRACNIPTKIVFTLRYNPDPQKDDFTKVTQGTNERFGHFIGACLADHAWRLYDFKWQWNPKFDEFYADEVHGLTHLRHRKDDGTIYVPVTYDGVYKPGETQKITDIGYFMPKDVVMNRDIIKRFAQDFLRKTRR